MSAEAARVPPLPRGEVLLSDMRRIGVIAVRMPDGLAVWIGEEARSPSDQSPGAFCPTARGLRVPAHLAEAVADEIRAVVRRRVKLELWRLADGPTP